MNALHVLYGSKSLAFAPGIPGRLPGMKAGSLVASDAPVPVDRALLSRHFPAGSSLEVATGSLHPGMSDIIMHEDLLADLIRHIPGRTVTRNEIAAGFKDLVKHNSHGNVEIDHGRLHVAIVAASRKLSRMVSRVRKLWTKSHTSHANPTMKRFKGLLNQLNNVDSPCTSDWPSYPSCSNAWPAYPGGAPRTSTERSKFEHLRFDVFLSCLYR